MDIASLQHSTTTSTTPADVPTERLLDNKQLTEDQKLGEVARQFEALLIRQILQDTQKTVIPSKLTSDSTAASIYHDMVGMQLADSISKSGSLGLAHMLQQQLSHQLHPASTAGRDLTPETQPTLGSGTMGARPSCSVTQTSVPSTPPSSRGTAHTRSHE
jgi:Rod binding domain-containing protein